MRDIFDFEVKAELYAVMGNPINHSKSPLIHAEFARQSQQKIIYQAIHVDLGGLSQAVRNFQANHGGGLNITVPFKVDALKVADHLTERAARAGAVNTLIFDKNGEITGDNTDGFGLVYDIEQHLKWPIKDQKILILGAGGATRGILAPLLEKHPASIFIANRTASRAKDLADDFASLGSVYGGSHEDLASQKFDLLINATSAGLQGEVPPIPASVLQQNCYCYDLMYGSEDTAFVCWAKQHQVQHIADGLGMLVGQAAESFYLWRHIRVEIAPVIKTIRELIKPE